MWIVVIAVLITVLFFTLLAFVMHVAINENYDIGGWDYDDDVRKDE